MFVTNNINIVTYVFGLTKKLPFPWGIAEWIQQAITAGKHISGTIRLGCWGSISWKPLILQGQWLGLGYLMRLYQILYERQPSSIRQADKAERTVTRICLLHFQCCHVILKKNNLKVEILRFPSSKRFLFVCSWDRATPKKSSHLNLDASSTSLPSNLICCRINEIVVQSKSVIRFFGGVCNINYIISRLRVSSKPRLGWNLGGRLPTNFVSGLLFTPEHLDLVLPHVTIFTSTPGMWSIQRVICSELQRQFLENFLQKKLSERKLRTIRYS